MIQVLVYKSALVKHYTYFVRTDPIIPTRSLWTA